MSLDYQYILIVDDNAGVRLLLNEALTNEGYNVELASDGKEALRKISERHPVLILLDEKMPGMTGSEVINTLNNNLALEVPVVMITAYSEQVCLKLGKHKQIKFMLNKPFDLKALSNIIRNLVTKN